MNRRVSEMLRRWFGRPLVRTAAPTFRPRLECLEDRLAPATFTVINTNDAGAGSLRAAIVSANANPGSTINFSIGSGGQVIFPFSSLPALVVPVTIDATTQPGYSGKPLIGLIGSLAGANASGLVLVGGNSTVKGLAIDNFATGFGLLLVSGGSNVVMQNNIGVNAAGTVAAPNSMGIFAIISNGNVIVDNIISGNSVYGVLLDASSNNGIVGNTIGLSAAGSSAVPNSVAGVAVAAGSIGNQILNNTIAGNGSFGAVFADPGTTANTVAGNTIGLTASGAAFPNGIAGVVLAAGTSGNTIGGATASAGNVISDNTLEGVILMGAGTANNTVSENFIGTNAAGSAAAANGDAGVLIQDGASSNVLSLNDIAGNNLVNVHILGAGTSGNLLTGNHIGTDAAGNTQIGSVDGVDFESSASGNVLIGNSISGYLGVSLVGTATTGNTLQGNRIGVNAAGTALLGNNFSAVYINYGSAGNMIGGSNRSLGNILATSQYGISLPGAGAGNVIANNLIGINAAGNASLGQPTGISFINTSNTQVLNNVISGNTGYGVHIYNSNNTTLAGNFIGTDAAGLNPVANGIGVFVEVNSTGNIIGGTTPAARNVLSGNNDGVVFTSAGVQGNSVQGNYIGVADNGSTPLPNGYGVFVTQGAHYNFIGGIAAGAGNVIAFNTGDGVLIGRNTGESISLEAGANNAVLANSIYSNGKIGIDLGPNDGVTANNSSGLILNSPTLSAAASLGNSVIVVGNWQSNSFSPGLYRVEVFANTTASPSGHGEGKVFLGFETVNVIAGGSGNFTLILAGSVKSGTVLSCTITDPFSNTSEFSTDVTVP